MQQSKAQLQLQFNWIFVLIVGAVLLIFFITLIAGQSKSNEQTMAINLAQRMETILSATEQQPGTVKEYDGLPPLSITFTCDVTEDYYNYVISGATPVDSKYRLLFSPRELSSDVLYTWTEAWMVPYYVTNFLYVTNDRQHYVFYNKTEFYAMNELYDDFPTLFSSRSWNANEDDKELNMESYTYVFFKRQLDNEPSATLEFLTARSGAQGKIIVIDPALSAAPFTQGTLYFIPLQNARTIIYDEDLLSGLNDDDVAKTAYLGKASLYGAIFSENKVTYECTMNKALQRLHMLTLLQYYRTQAIIPSVSKSCAHLLNNTFNGVTTYLRTLNQTIAENDFNSTFAEKANDLFIKLEKRNNQLATQTYCPTLY